MKTLELNQMTSIEGGSSPKTKMCVTIGLFAIITSETAIGDAAFLAAGYFAGCYD